MWENETERSIIKDNAPLKKSSFAIPQCSDNDGIILVQAAICTAIIIFVLLSRTISASFFGDIKEQYAQLMKSGIDLSGQGELIRFVSDIVDNVRIQAKEIMSGLDANEKALGGAAEGSALNFTPFEFSYKLSVTPFTPVSGNRSSGFEKRINPISNKKEFHSGIDLAAPQGSKVFSAFGGVIEAIGFDEVRGNYILIRHTNNLLTLYQHLEKTFVKEKESVLRGQIIGAVGKTGLATGYHLHFEIILDGYSVNPEKVLKHKE